MIVDIMTNGGSSHKRKGGDTATSMKPHHSRLNKLSNGSQISTKMVVNVAGGGGGSRNQTSAKRGLA
jgi:hypothetical protein